MSYAGEAIERCLEKPVLLPSLPQDVDVTNWGNVRLNPKDGRDGVIRVSSGPSGTKLGIQVILTMSVHTLVLVY